MTKHEAQGSNSSSSSSSTILPIPLDAEPKIGTAEILITKEEDLLKFKNELLGLIDLMEVNFSLISRMSAYWSKVSIKNKLIIGAILLVSIIIIPHIIASIFLENLSAYSFFTYLVGSFLLSDHESQKEDNKTRLKEGISRLSNILNEMIKQLNQLSIKMEGEVTRFQNENQHLAEEIKDLSKEKTALKEERQRLVENTLKLEKNLEKFTKTTSEQEKFIETMQQELRAAKEAYEKNSLELSAKIKELDLLTDREKVLTQQVDNLNDAVETLEKTSSLIQGLALRVCKDRSATEIELKDFIAQSQASFDKQLKTFEQEIAKIQNITEVLKPIADNLKQGQEGTTFQASQESTKPIDLDFSNASLPKNLAALLENQGFYATLSFPSPPSPKKEPTNGYAH